MGAYNNETAQQAALEYLKDQMQQGKMNAAQANVEKVRWLRVELITCSVPCDVRKALNAAVKEGKLGHMKKDGRKPECYFHPDFEYLAKQERHEYEIKTIEALKAICV